MVDRIVSLWLNVACEFKRAGFLEGQAIGTSLPIGPFRLAGARGAANSAVGLPVPHIQENRPA